MGASRPHRSARTALKKGTTSLRSVVNKNLHKNPVADRILSPQAAGLIKLVKLVKIQRRVFNRNRLSIEQFLMDFLMDYLCNWVGWVRHYIRKGLHIATSYAAYVTLNCPSGRDP